MNCSEDIKKLSEESMKCMPQVKDALLKKYDIPLNHTDFAFVEKCQDGKELEKIVQILRSGEEGYYPELQKLAEERLASIKPKSKFLRKVVPVMKKHELTKDEQTELEQDLSEWVKTVNKSNKELTNRKSSKIESEVKVRQNPLTPSNKACDQTKRISSTDYKSWDKYDPDTEIVKMDLEEEKIIKEAKSKPKSKSKKVRFNKFATEPEAGFIAEREREKGNEFFRSGNYEDALECYNTSLEAKSSLAALNNRALTLVKLKKFENALKDCDKVLEIDSKNLKALARKAECLEKLNRTSEALACGEEAITLDPNNQQMQELCQRTRKLTVNSQKKTTVAITEVSDDEDDVICFK